MHKPNLQTISLDDNVSIQKDAVDCLNSFLGECFSIAETLTHSSVAYDDGFIPRYGTSVVPPVCLMFANFVTPLK
jgi:hypothetical protein